MSSSTIRKAGGERGAARRGDRARGDLLDVAEQLFAERGIDAVSMREIAEQAGQRNTAAVKYHFSDKRGLITALLTDRLIKVERLRQTAVAKAGDLSTYDIEALLEMMFQSMLDLCSESAWVVEFHVAYNSTPWGRDEAIPHPIIAHPDIYPASIRILEELQRRFTSLGNDEIRYRTGLAFMMFWVALSRHRSRNTGEIGGFSLEMAVKVAATILET